ncbi:hypothetical protein HYC85_000066 [Camellia sinensis]|uniref:Uncharacterized protein n=1 Tax=Camellia sinensis TaxID=4442 RepID=A0A7J7FS71_CAMSI|nr:hypothetical protein HYC85_000066 [Camellia sinensis]
MNSDGCNLQSVVAGCSLKNMVPGNVIDVDAVGGDSKFSSFGINNRHAVWKILMEREKDIVSTAYDRYGNE